jgi:fibronectin type 3 domain-containing protein
MSPEMCRRGPRKPVALYLVLLVFVAALAGIGLNFSGSSGIASSPVGGPGLSPFNVANPTIDTHAIKSCSAVTSCESPSETLAYPGDAIFVFVATNFSGAAYIQNVKDQAGHTLTNLTHASDTISNNRLNVTVYEEYNVAEYSAMTIFVNTSASETFGFEWVAIYGTSASPVDALGTASTGHGTAATATVTTATANDLVLMGLTSGAGAAANSAGTGNTLVANTGSTPTGTVFYETRTPTGSLTSNATLPSAKSWAAIDIALLLGSAPSVPTGLAQSAATWTTVTWTWNAPAGSADVVNYSLARFNGAGCTSTRTGATTTSPTYTVSSLSAGTGRWAEVGAYNSTGFSGYSSCFGPAASIAGPPTGASAASASSTSITVSWTNPVTSPTSGVLTNDYLYWELGTSCSSPTMVNIGSVSTTYTITGLTFGDTYCAYVEAVDPGGTSNASGTVTDTLQVPSSPTGVTQSSATWTVITWTWTAPAGTVSNYTIYRYSLSGCTGPQSASSITSATYSLGNLNAGTGRWVEVTAWNASGQSARTACYGPADTIPGPPTSPAAAPASTTSITVTWTNPATTPSSGVLTDDYVYWEAGSSCSSATKIDIGSVTTTYTKTGLTTGTQYCFYIEAVDNGGTSNATSVVTAVTASVPAAPMGVSAAPVGTTQATVTWANPTTGGLVNNTIRRATGSSCNFNYFINIGAVTGSDTSGGLTPNTVYCWSVAVWNATGMSAWSSTVTMVTGSVPGAATSLTVSSVTTTSVSLSWTNPSTGGLVNVTIYEAVGTACSYSVFISLASVPTTHTVSPLSSGVTYCFAIQEWNATGGSALSSSATAFTPTVPGAPVGLSGAGTTNSITWTWVNPGGGGLVNDTLYYWTGAACSGLVTAKSTSGAATTITVGSLAVGQEFAAEVAAWNATGQSPLSSCATASTGTPAPPYNLTVASFGPVTITLKWSLPTNYTVANVTVWYGVSCPGVVPVSAGGGATTYVLTGLTNGATYYITVQSFEGSVGSVRSNCVEETTGVEGGGGAPPNGPPSGVPLPNPTQPIAAPGTGIVLPLVVWFVVAGAILGIVLWFTRPKKPKGEYD